MADAKSGYSETATKFTHSESGKFEGLKSKAREAKYNENWKTQSVNINEVVEKFAPNAEGVVKNGKFIYFGDSYNIITDMTSGYLRIMKVSTKEYVKLDGTPGSLKETHFKIKRREEMKKMMFALIKDDTNLDRYGDIPEVFGATEDEAEIYKGDWDDGVMLCENLLPEIDARIEGCLLDLSDIDYFDKSKCIILNDILCNKLKEPCSERLHELYTVLSDFVNKAINMGTGVVIEL